MINNVLEEIKKLRIHRANAQADLKSLYVHPTHFNLNKDANAHRTVNNISGLYGTGEDRREYTTVGPSNYKNDLFTGDKQKDFRSTVSSASKDGIYKSDYFNKFYGIPKNLKILNDDNTLYYEKKLGKTTEFDYAIGNMTDDFDRQAGLQSIVSTFLKKRKESKAEFQTDNAFHKEFNKQTKPVAKQPPVPTNAPSVFVQPAFAKAVDPVEVGPAVTTLTKGEAGLQKLAKKYKAANVIKDTLRRQYDMKRYDKAKTATATATTEPAVTRSQSEKSTTTPRTPLTKKGKK